MFEVVKHDGPGRIGKINWADEKNLTPSLLHPRFPHIEPVSEKELITLNVLPDSFPKEQFYNVFMTNPANPYVYSDLTQSFDDQLKLNPQVLPYLAESL